MLDLGQSACPIASGRYGEEMFLTQAEIHIGETAQSLAEWVAEGFHVLDFPWPAGLSVDCKTAREILVRAGLKNTGKLN